MTGVWARWSTKSAGRRLRFEQQTPLLRDHSQWSVTAIPGSVLDVTVDGDELNGWLEFGRDLDEQTEAIWRRVEQGHLRRGSIGYDYTRADYETIPAGESRTIRGRSFTAPKDRSLRVVFRWRLREYSMVVIPADARATLKNQSPTDSPDESSGGGPQGTHHPGGQQSATESRHTAPAVSNVPTEAPMKRFLQFLHRHGLAATVTSEADALQWARSGNLSAALITELADLCKQDNVEFDPASATPAARPPRLPAVDRRPAARQERRAWLPPPAPRRWSASRQAGSDAPSTPIEQLTATLVEGIDPTRAAADAVAAERQRVTEIRALASQHPDVPETVVQQAEQHGWDLDQTRSAFLVAMRGARQTGAPAIHSRGSHQITRQVLQAALLERGGIRPESDVWNSVQARSLMGRRRELDLTWAIGVAERGQQRDNMEQAFDIANREGLTSISFLRLAELCVELGQPGVRLYNQDEILERAFTSGDFTAVFGAVVHMQLLDSYAKTTSVWREFCEAREVGDFRPHDTADMGQVSRLKKLGRNGGDAELLNTEEQTLARILIERYAGRLVVDEQTIINDAFGVTDRLPGELGQTCASMIDDMAAAQYLRTDNLDDGRARYNNTDGNLVAVTAISELALSHRAPR